jgi:hypothetical protein
MYVIMLAYIGGKTMKVTLPRNVRVSGPYYNFSKPYGTFVTLQRDEWYVAKKLTKRQQKTEFQKITGETCLGSIVKFRNRKDYVISQLHPRKAFSSLQKAINFLIENQGKLVFCS